ncbi:YgaP family membrane protein [Desulfitobacterium metallireducens]|uniref:Sulfurtransferase n=1 Tax=Desulfitobacterium metallireducens DSM 15288 TaxID=871968 RepID=W0E598_9FIRM|nr:YgaP-like transmembrane domain [Desulfitobacterium metallireducens]AHF05937.1 sulfurtransferase [Desulfitobacterium metallireducens DSM 15288]
MYIVNGKGSWIRLIAGFFVLASVLLGVFVSKYWLLFTGLVGIMLMTSSLTGFCPMELILKAIGAEQRKVSS